MNCKITLLVLLPTLITSILFGSYFFSQKSSLVILGIILLGVMIAITISMLISRLIARPLTNIKSLMQKIPKDPKNNLVLQASDLKHSLEETEIQNVQLNITLKNLEKDIQKKSEFIASLTHEIRTPMSSILGFTKLLLEDDLTKYQQDYLITIQKSADTLLAIINNILDLSKIEAGKFKLDTVPFDFYDVVDDVLQSLAAEAQRKQLELIPLLSADIPAKVMGDPLRLKQILTNLLFNAIKFTEEGSVCLKIKLLKQDADKISLEINVIDTGIGLTEDDSKNLFKKFSQADTLATGKFGGTGLGLIISKQLIEQMGGHIEVHSKINIGTTVQFSINLTVADKDVFSLKQPKKINKVILIYDSLSLSRQAINQYLFSRLKHLILIDTIEQLKLKLSQLKHENMLPDQIILSFTNFESQTHAKEILTFLKNQYDSSITVLINTAKETTINELVNCGATNCIIKPLSLKKLLSAINPPKDYPFATAENPYFTEDIAAADYTNAKLLIAEDNTANLKLIINLLDRIGITADTAIDGKLACQACDEKKYSLIFLDLNMPILNGYQATEIIRNNSHYNQTTPIIAISAYITDKEKEKLYDAGINDLIIKPFDINILEKIIKKWDGKVIKDHKKNNIDLPLDLERTIKLSAGNKKLALEIIQMFIKEIPIFLEKIKLFYANKNWVGLKDVIHKIHGSAHFCAMTRLQKTAEEFEIALTNSSIKNYPNLYEKINKDINDLLEYIELNLPELKTAKVN